MNFKLYVESGQSWMHNKIIPTELLSFMVKYTLPFNHQSAKSHYN